VKIGEEKLGAVHMVSSQSGGLSIADKRDTSNADVQVKRSWGSVDQRHN